MFRCRVCRSTDIKKFLDLGKQPFANALLKSPSQKEKKYPLELAFCMECSLVQLLYTANPKDLFSNYLWITGTSPVTRAHAEYFFKRVMKDNQTKMKVLEVGSNDGTFLMPFKKAGMDVLGIDPAKNMKKLAQVPTITAFFNSKLARKYKKMFDLVIARNVLPHVKDTNDFMKGLEIVMTDKGKLVLEIHYAKKIWEDLHYDAVYHEHLCYFSLKSLEILLHKYNLYVEDIASSPINAGNIIVICKKRFVKEKKIVNKYREEEIYLNILQKWEVFTFRVKKHKEKLLELLSKYSGLYLAGAGASARSSTLLNYCGINLGAIAEINPLKQGLYTAGSHILILSSEKVIESNPDCILILAWNFKNAIMKELKQKGYKGHFIIPLPKPYEI